MTARRVLLVDDEPTLRGALAEALAFDGHEAEQAGSIAEAERLFFGRGFDTVVTDLRLPDGSGLELLARLRAADPSFRAIVATGFGTYEQAVESIRLRVAAFLSKPFSVADLLRAVGEERSEAAPRPEPGIDEELARLGVSAEIGARASALAREAQRNAAVHAYPEGDGPVETEVRREGDALVVVVADRGCGFDVAAALARGLDASRERDPGLLRLHRDADEIRIRSTPGKGSRVELRWRLAFDGDAAPLRIPADDDLATACLWS